MNNRYPPQQDHFPQQNQPFQQQPQRQPMSNPFAQNQQPDRVQNAYDNQGP